MYLNIICQTCAYPKKKVYTYPNFLCRRKRINIFKEGSNNIAFNLKNQYSNGFNLYILLVQKSVIHTYLIIYYYINKNI